MFCFASRAFQLVECSTTYIHLRSTFNSIVSRYTYASPLKFPRVTLYKSLGSDNYDKRQCYIYPSDYREYRTVNCLMKKPSHKVHGFVLRACLDFLRSNILSVTVNDTANIINFQSIQTIIKCLF